MEASFRWRQLYFGRVEDWQAGGRYGRALKGAGRLSHMRHGAGGAELLGGWLAGAEATRGWKGITEAVTEQRGLSDFIVITTIMELGGYGAAGTDATSRKLTSTSAIVGYRRVLRRAGSGGRGLRGVGHAC